MSAPFITFFTILTGWGAATVGTPLFPLPLVLGGLLVAQRRWGLIALCVALSPMTAGLVMGTVGYCTGTARVHGMGLPGFGYFNLDPELRCERSTGGCVVNGGEFLTQTPNNFAIVTLTRLFGPQPGTYTGPYPNETQAKAALLASAMPVSLDGLVQDRVDVGASPVKLDLGVGAELLRRGPYACIGGTLADDAPQWLNEVGPPSAALYQNQCLILRLPQMQGAMIALIDTKSGRPFAYYLEGECHERFPPVRWRK
jgi:hypothetical protein